MTSSSGSASESGTPLFASTASREQTLRALRSLRDVLEESHYQSARMLPMPGKVRDLPIDLACLSHLWAGGSNLFHRSAVPWLYRSIVRRTAPRAAELHRLFLLGETLSAHGIEALLPAKLTGELREAGILERADGGLRSRVMITPYRGGCYVSDPLWMQGRDSYVYMGRASFTPPDVLLAEPAASPPSGRLLDVGCGSAIGALSVAHRFEEVVGVDIVPRCLEYATLNAAINQIPNARFHDSDLYTQVGGTFHTIIANPPFAWIDEEVERPLTHAFGGGDFGTELPRRILAGALGMLEPGGRVISTMDGVWRKGVEQIVGILQSVFEPVGADVVVYRLFDEFNFKRARAYRRHGISKAMRYVVVVRAAQGFKLTFARLDTPVYVAYRLRLALPRLVAALKRS